MEAGNYKLVNLYILEMLGIVFFTSMAGAMRTSIFIIMSEAIAKQLRYDFFESILNKDVAFYDDNRTGDLISRLNNDI